MPFALRRSSASLLLTALLYAFVLPLHAAAQQQGEAPNEPVVPLEGTLERITVHGDALEGNLVGDDPDRAVSVYLPPGYDADAGRRYPVLYLLHGFTDSDLNWFGWRRHFVNVPAAFEESLDAGEARAMILVMPNAYTAFAGSFYSSSVTTGDWETFVAEELVDYVDAHYRTVPERASRGLAGHSMGGYGTLRIGMKRPDVFSSLYAMSPCCLRPNLEASGDAVAQAQAIERLAEIQQAGFMTKAILATAAAWSPNPDAPPLYLDLPGDTLALAPDARARWAANAPLAMMHQYVPALRSFAGLALDAGAQDQLGIAGDTRAFADVLARYGIEHTVDIYSPGDHTSRIGERMRNHVLPFFSERLAFP